MKNKIKEFLDSIIKGKEVKGEPLDLTPGLKVKKTVQVGGRFTFNEIAENILRQKEAMR
jgi:hypothetical protein